eukprot:648782-Pelagomonas_calceolata.AAC.1
MIPHNNELHRVGWLGRIGYGTIPVLWCLKLDFSCGEFGKYSGHRYFSCEIFLDLLDKDSICSILPPLYPPPQAEKIRVVAMVATTCCILEGKTPTVTSTVYGGLIGINV